MIYGESRLKRLPKWAQDYIAALQKEHLRLIEKNKVLVEMSQWGDPKMEWFSFENHAKEECERYFTLHRNDAKCQFTLSPGDRIFIGRVTR